MGLLDKIKNALFEVEYVEVEEAPKKEEKIKEKKKKEDKPIAKKIVLPGKREEKVEELHEEELKDEDFEIRPKDETIVEKPHDEFKIMEDKDFAVDEDLHIDTPEILQVIDENEDIPSREGRHVDNPEFIEERVRDPYPESKPVVEERYPAPDYHEGKLYGIDPSYNVPVHPYGTYEKKEEKNYFRPSPIISPIYGILDKNYKKEDVKEKREVHLSSSYSRNSLNVDDIRDKAYGDKKREEVKKEKVENIVEEKTEPVVDQSSKFSVEEEEDNLLVDLSDRAKPEVKELTMGDALEYFQDLGLEYNVDYVDVSKEKGNAKKTPEEVENVMAEDIENATADLDPVVEKVQEEKKVEKKPDKKQEEKAVEDDNDNLFDLIDSMYQDKD